MLPPDLKLSADHHNRTGFRTMNEVTDTERTRHADARLSFWQVCFQARQDPFHSAELVKPTIQCLA